MSRYTVRTDTLPATTYKYLADARACALRRADDNHFSAIYKESAQRSHLVACYSPVDPTPMQYQNWDERLSDAPKGAPPVRWIVTVEDSTDALDYIGDEDAPDPLIRATRTYKTKRGALAFVDRTAGAMRGYFVLEHVVTDDEIYLRCGGLMEADHVSRIYEIVGKRDR